MNQLPEPWLRGTPAGIDPVIAHLLRSSQQIREDLADITTEHPSVCFHLRHLAGSTDRLCTYLEGNQLNDRQLAALSAEHEPGPSVTELLANINSALDRYDALIQTLTPHQFAELREVGRQRLPVTAISLAIHIAEHGQRHTGQALSLAKVLCLIER